MNRNRIFYNKISKYESCMCFFGAVVKCLFTVFQVRQAAAAADAAGADDVCMHV